MSQQFFIPSFTLNIIILIDFYIYIYFITYNFTDMLKFCDFRKICVMLYTVNSKFKIISFSDQKE